MAMPTIRRQCRRMRREDRVSSWLDDWLTLTLNEHNVPKVKYMVLRLMWRTRGRERDGGKRKWRKNIMDRKAKAIFVLTLTSGCYFRTSCHHMFYIGTIHTYWSDEISFTLWTQVNTMSVCILKRLDCRKQHQNRHWIAVIVEKWCTIHVHL